MLFGVLEANPNGGVDDVEFQGVLPLVKSIDEVTHFLWRRKVAPKQQHHS